MEFIGYPVPQGDCHTQQGFHYMGQRGELRVDQAHRGYCGSTDEGAHGSYNPLYMRWAHARTGRACVCSTAAVGVSEAEGGGKAGDTLYVCCRAVHVHDGWQREHRRCGAKSVLAPGGMALGTGTDC